MDCRQRWFSNEFASIRLGDARLNRRFFQIAEDFSGQPQSPINQASGSWSKAKAAYRFFGNSNVDHDKIRDPHIEQTFFRLKAQRNWVFAIQDTSSVDFSKHIKTTGLGPIAAKNTGFNGAQGLMLHTTLALSDRGMPLGLLDQQIWTRPPEPAVRGAYRFKKAKDRESYKWITSLENSVHSLSDEQRSRLVTLCDREADLFELMDRAIELKTHILVRAHHDRVLSKSYAYQGIRAIHLSDFMKKQPIHGYLTVEVPAVKFCYPARTARLAVKFAQIEILAPRRPRSIQTKQQAQKKIRVFSVWVKEQDVPHGVQAIEWKLFTTVPVQTFDDAAERVKWYALRWQIEVFHRILKSGCRVEACRLETADKLKKYVALYSIIAWHIHQLTYLNRIQPETSCAQALSETQWKPLHLKFNPTQPIPKTPPSTRQALRWIAQLGGFLARKNDGEPGPTTLWRGWQRMIDISQTYELLHPQ